MSCHPYFQPAPAGWEQALETKHEHKLKHSEVLKMGLDLSKLRNSRFLKKEDVGDGLLVTIAKFTEEDVGLEKAEIKQVMHFKEDGIKPLVMNFTNGEAVEDICGGLSDEATVGKQLVLYNDPSVSFGGKRIGGIRVRAPAAPPAPAAPAPAADANFDDDILF